MGQVLLTFDTEDFISKNSVDFLHSLLLCLNKHDFKALFFVTGHMAEKLEEYPETVELLREHEVGYHSSGHSVHPAIFEFTDIERYKEAYDVSLARETSHINPLTGQIEGKGGILAVRSLLNNKEVTAYRAPGFCWSPPHSEALRDLGLTFDFSSIIAQVPVFYKGFTFYPYPALLEWRGTGSDYRVFLSSALRRKITVIGLHPSLFVNQENWDAIYQQGNPQRITPPQPKTDSQSRLLFKSFDLLLKRAKRLERLGLLRVGVDLIESEKVLAMTANQVEEVCEFSLRWPKNVFKYEPKHMRNHFFKFFEIPAKSS